MSTTRKSNTELLRIVAMTRIWACHLTVHGIRHWTVDYANMIF